MGKQYIVRLLNDELGRATQLSESAAVPSRVRLRSSMLLAAHEGLSDQQIAIRLETSVTTVQRIRKRYTQVGFNATVGWDGQIPTMSPEHPNLTQACVCEALASCLQIEGVVGAALVDYHRGICLGKTGGEIDLEIAATGNAEVIRLKLQSMSHSNPNDEIEDVVITLTSQYHLLRMFASQQGLFLYAILNRGWGNLAMARLRIQEIVMSFVI